MSSPKSCGTGRASSCSGFSPRTGGCRWLGPACAKGVVERSDEGLLDAMVFASSGEVEGLLKSLKELGWEWEMMRRRWPNLVVVAHGPVTAAGAESLGVNVNVVSERFDSFQGTVWMLSKPS